VPCPSCFALTFCTLYLHKQIPFMLPLHGLLAFTSSVPVLTVQAAYQRCSGAPSLHSGLQGATGRATPLSLRRPPEGHAWHLSTALAAGPAAPLSGRRASPQDIESQATCHLCEKCIRECWVAWQVSGNVKGHRCSLMESSRVQFELRMGQASAQALSCKGMPVFTACKLVTNVLGVSAR